jgi:3-deoxy-D-manno-octulosonate 8-phosphate phosphatase (KDO 8-P phosphatase)
MASTQSKIKNFVIDCDGCLTDGKFTYTKQGKISKVYGPDDSDALDILKNRGIKIYFISGDKRGFAVTKKRVEDMKFTAELVSTFKRLEWMKKRMKLKETVFMGDGIYDSLVFPYMTYSIAPQNAFYLTKEKANYVTKAWGGEGAVAEACVHIMEKFLGGFKLHEIDFSKGSGAW